MRKNIPNIHVVVQDMLGNNSVFLSFGRRHSSDEDKVYKKEDYIFSATQEDREYLKRVFSENYTKEKFSAHDGNYELYFPISMNGKIIVLYLTDKQRYGEFGS